MTDLRPHAYELWEQGISSHDATIIELQYGYNPQETETICTILADMERQADKRLRKEESK